jgi:hypothetical protein
MGDRKKVHSGMTKLQTPRKINIVYDAELEPPGCRLRVCLLMNCCSSKDLERSYLYLRENSLESNEAITCCFGLCYGMDFINVTYFDRPPYEKTCKPSPFPCCCLCNSAQPRLDVLNRGCIVCCIPIKRGKSAIVMPFERFPAPCCCCTNRVGWWDNCCGLCGPISGNPKIYSTFSPQPKDAEAFVKVAHATMSLDSADSFLLAREKDSSNHHNLGSGHSEDGSISLELLTGHFD